MRRPITFVFAAFAGGIFLGYYMGIIACLCLLGGVIFISSIMRQYRSAIFVMVAVMGTCAIYIADAFPDPLLSHEGEVVCVEGDAVSIEAEEAYLKILLKPEYEHLNFCAGRRNLIVNVYFPGENQNELVRIIKEQKQKLLGKKIRVTGRLSLPSEARNPGLFNYRLYLKSKKISAVISVNLSHVEITGERMFFLSAPSKLKAHFSSILDNRMDRDSKTLLMGILFGDKTMIEEDIYEIFQRNGCAHILSVSGIHVSIIYVYISKIFKNRRNKAAIVCILLLLLFYAALAEFSPSAVRAVTMIAIHILSKPLHRRYDFQCSISASAMLMLICNPYSLFNIGFQLSYLAVFALSFAMPLAQEKINGKAALLRPFTPIFTIQAGMAPAIAYHFMYFSVSAFFLNLPIIALSGLILPLGVCLTLFSVIPRIDIVMDPLFLLIEATIKLMIKMNQIAADISISSMNVKAPPLFVLAIFYGFFFFMTSESFWILLREKNIKGILSVCIIIAVLASAVPMIMKEDLRRGDIVFLDVGQGDCIHIKTSDGRNVLIDGGGARDYDVGKKILLPYFLKNRISKVDLALITHLHQDHYGGLASLCKLMPVKQLGVYEGNKLKEAMLMRDTGLKSDDILYIASGDRIALNENQCIEVLYPENQTAETYENIMLDEEDENLSCLVMKICYGDVSILVTGDVGFQGEEKLIGLMNESNRGLLQAKILKVGHHGSRFSTGDEFLDYVNPRVAVIQSGKNNFGHPHPDTIEKLTKKGIMIFRNDNQGAIILKVTKNSLKIHTMLVPCNT